jgi:CRISPR-associated protein Csh1
MIEALYTLGKELLEEEDKEWVWEEPEADYLLILKFSNGKPRGVEVRKDIPSFGRKLLFKRIRASRRCNSSTPTIYLNLAEPEKTVSCLRAIFGWLEKYGYRVNLDLGTALEKLKEWMKERNFSKERVLLTTEIDGKLPGEIPELVKAFKKGFLKDMGFEDGICSLCGEKKKVSGLKSPFAFYTLDKIGFISGFSKDSHFRGFPICFDCFRALEEAKSFLEKHRFRLAKGAPFYWLVPNLIKHTGEGLELDHIYYLYDIESLRKQLKLTEGEEQRLADVQEDLLDYLKELKDSVSFHFIFVSKKQAQELIKLHIQDVFPSRLKELFEVKHFAERLSGIDEFTFSTLSSFYYEPNSKDRQVEKEFLELLDRIFRKIPVSELALIRRLLKGVQSAYYEEVNGKERSLQKKIQEAFASYLFAKFSTEGIMEEPKATSVKEFVDNLPLLREAEEKGLFLIGVLTQALLKSQALARKGSKPFLKKLAGFRLNQRGFEKLTVELLDKLESYEAFGKKERKLFELASWYFSQAKPNWNLTLERMNFIFAVGMGMKEKVYGILKQEGSHD